LESCRKSGRKGQFLLLIRQTEPPQTDKAGLRESRANEALDAFIIFTED